ncbi:RNA-binding asch domain protein [Anaeramoeba flamelloides]|uniref:RNA-binding asch domain protein n=1 Tax=Anaeramoeba flamelloides TaxID=1746091 RepID=A0ABQ8X927_9EUKA|nr:RNA-binding asch domain protein [Anaeramoeba flamelloides]
MTVQQAIFEYLNSIIQEKIVSKVLSCDQAKDLIAIEETNEKIQEKIKTFQDYPSQPLYQEITKNLIKWSEEEEFPIQFPPLKNLPSFDPKKEMDKHTALAKDFVNDPTQKKLESLFNTIGIDGVRSLLKLRTTDGCVKELFPPNLQVLYKSFQKPFLSIKEKKRLKEIQTKSTKTIIIKGKPVEVPLRQTKRKSFKTLTVGARALAKHCHRSGENWWIKGTMRGKMEFQNEVALGCLDRVVKNVVWINIHSITLEKTRDIKLFEIRTLEGYGARWVINKRTNGKEIIQKSQEKKNENENEKEKGFGESEKKSENEENEGEEKEKEKEKEKEMEKEKEKEIIQTSIKKKLLVEEEEEEDIVFHGFLEPHQESDGENKNKN